MRKADAKARRPYKSAITAKNASNPENVVRE